MGNDGAEVTHVDGPGGLVAPDVLVEHGDGVAVDPVRTWLVLYTSVGSL